MTATFPTTIGRASAATAPVLRRRWTRAVWNAAAVAVIWVTSLVVVALWVADAGVQAIVGGGAEALTTLGRLTGLVSANLLLYQVLLMARVPLFERGFGRDGITRMHRLVGFSSFSLLLVHIALLVAGYAAQAGIDVFTQLWQFVWDYPGMLLATAGTLLLVLVVASSLRRARRRLRYESWHLLHLYGYLGVGLAVPHMLWTGADFLASPLATIYWWTLWAVAAAGVVVFRVGVPVVRSLRHDVRVASVEPDGDRGVTVRMRGRGLAALRARPGQFFVWRFLDGAGWMRGHPFSLAAAPTGNALTISARIVGDGTRRLAGLNPGTRVVFEGPYGVMTGEVRAGTKLLMIGAGAGVAPLVSLLEGEAYAPGAATLVVREHVEEDALLRGPIARLVSTRGVTHYALNGPRAASGSTWMPASHAAWRGSDLLRHLAPRPAEYDVFLCGPGPWMDALRRDLHAAGFAPSRIHAEAFAR
ncbi:oxidoreductase [Microbacterium saccharophilum]|uniref:Oxidoreductase n=1 Tax=Microbacterium saccharophilum TaxID=1213358 RepID=A0A5C8I7C1_9MICO|nr:ferric reductase-like transmembrane domain-containing protein [Microbacterium saccharophilum]TXK15055.1 oxidoreductase [Microbacterium saccharophilum]